MKTIFMMSAVAAVALASSAAFAQSGPAPITVRPPEGRVWQTCLDRSEDLRWPWIDGADSVRVVFASLCTGRRRTVSVGKTEGELYGTSSWPTLAEGEEHLYDVTLTYLSGAEVLESHAARVALIPGVKGGEGAVVRDVDSRAWGKSRVEHPMFAYDAAWSTGVVTQVSLVRQAGVDAVSETTLDGLSGYDVALAVPSASLSLLFDGEEALSALVRYAPIGTTIIVR
jgi:hypothetical protein